jgi:hypothetical protein
MTRIEICTDKFPAFGCSSGDRSPFEQPPILGAMSMQKQTFAAVLVAGAILGFGAAEMIHAQVPGYATKVLMKTDLQNLPGQEAIFYASDWPLNIHAGSRVIGKIP